MFRYNDNLNYPKLIKCMSYVDKCAISEPKVKIDVFLILYNTNFYIIHVLCGYSRRHRLKLLLIIVFGSKIFRIERRAILDKTLRDSVKSY